MPGPGFLDLPVRSGKPRRTGITHVLDRGIPLAQVSDLLEQNGCYVDVWKLGWGIAYLDPQLAAKLDLLARHRVLASPGGTLLEIAWAQGRTSEFLDWAADAGFPCVEVSAGTVPMEDAAKRDLIAAAAERFIVLAEVGSKRAAVRLTPEQWAQAAECRTGCSRRPRTRYRPGRRRIGRCPWPPPAAPIPAAPPPITTIRCAIVSLIS